MLTRLYSNTALNVYMWVSIFAFSLLRSSWITESDILWQTRDGLDQLQRGSVTTHDQWSWMLFGEEWVPNSWLFNLLLGIAYKLAGVLGISILSFILVFILLALVKIILNTNKNLSIAKQFAILAVMSVALFGWLSTRPQIIDYILIALYLLVVIKISKSNLSSFKKIVTLYLVGFFLIIVWQNFHLTGLFGIICFAFILLIFSPVGGIRQLLVPAGSIMMFLPALLLTPYGLNGVIKTTIVSNQSWGIIIEWMNIPQLWGYSVGNTSNMMMVFLFTCQWVIGFALCYWASYRKLWWLFAGLSALGILSFIAVRFIPYFVLFGMLVFLFDRRSGSESTTNFSSIVVNVKEKLGQSFLLIAPILVLLLTTISGFFFFYQQTSETVIASPSVSSLVSKIPERSKVLTFPANSGFMILTRPDLQVALDGRNDLYGRDRYGEVFILFNERTTVTDFVGFLDQYGVDAYFVDPVRDNMTQDTHVSNMLNMLGWSRHQVDTAYLYLKP